MKDSNKAKLPAKKALRELSDKERMFAEAYVGEAKYDARKAYTLAGYVVDPKKGNYGRMVLSRPHVKAAVQKLIEEYHDASFLSKDIILSALWQEAHLEGKGSSHAARITALAWIGKELGMFKEAEKKEEKEGNTINIINFAVDPATIEKEVNTPAVITAAKALDTALDVKLTDYGSLYGRLTPSGAKPPGSAAEQVQCAVHPSSSITAQVQPEIIHEGSAQGMNDV